MSTKKRKSITLPKSLGRSASKPRNTSTSKRKRAQDLLDETQQRLALAIHSANVGLWDWDLHTNKVYFSREWKSLLGYEVHEISDDFAEWENRVHPDDVERAKAIVNAYLENPSPNFQNEFRMRHKDGSYRWILAQASLLTDEQGKPTRMLGSHIDITERKQAEKDLRESEDLFSKIFTDSPIALSIVGLPDGKNIKVNDAWCKLTGFSREEAIGYDTGELKIFDPQERNKLIREFSNQGYSNLVESEITTKSSGKKNILITSELITLKESRFIIASVIDITERKRAEEELRLSEERFSKAFHVSPAGVTITRIVDGKFIDVNDAFLRMYEFSRTDVIGHTSIELNILSPEERTKLIQAQLESGGLRNAELQARAKSGRLIHILFSSKPMEVEGESCHVTTMIDITERKQAEAHVQQQLQQLHALRTIDQAITSTLDLHVTLNILLEQVSSQLGVDATTVLLFDPSTATLEFAAGHGFHSRAIQQAQLRFGEGYAGRAALERRTVHIPNVIEAGGDPARALLLKEESFVAYYGVPLIAKGQIRGVLELFHRSPLDPDPEWVDFLETLAGQAAIAIDDARLLDGLQRSNTELLLAYDATIEGWSRAMDLRDKETEGHTQRVTDMTVQLARAAGLISEEIVQVRRGALLHDIGKLGVPDSILFNPDKLTDDEWLTMKNHPQYAYEMLAPIQYLRSALDIPYCHHEKWDGTGYPRGLTGEQIPLAARLFAVVDVWDALRSARPYRAGWPEEKVLEHIRTQAGTHFDPKAVELFFQVLDEREHNSKQSAG